MLGFKNERSELDGSLQLTCLEWLCYMFEILAYQKKREQKRALG